MINIILVVYNIVFLVGMLFFIPVQIYRKKLTLQALGEKCAVYSPGVKMACAHIKQCIWIHAVSVGEIVLIKKLIKELAKSRQYDILISTTTRTGKSVAEKLYPQHLTVFLPFDIIFFVRRALALFNPLLFISIETEIWPNLYIQLKKKRTPVIILNGRISDKAFQRYRKVRRLAKRILQFVDFVGVQTEYYKTRFLRLGIEEEKVKVTGNLKFSAFDVDQNYVCAFQKRFAPLLKEKDTLLIIAASTHPGEEEIMLDVYRKVIEKFPQVRLLLAPRHIERASSIEKLCVSKKWKPVRISMVLKEEGSADVFILDTIGDLFYFYSLCDVCVMGGSFVDYGGHNILEPLCFSKPTLFGPYMSNFKEIECKVLSMEAGVKVDNKDKLLSVLERLLRDVTLRKALSINAEKIFKEGTAILQKNKNIILQWLP